MEKTNNNLQSMPQKTKDRQHEPTKTGVKYFPHTHQSVCLTLIYISYITFIAKVYHW